MVLAIKDRSTGRTSTAATGDRPADAAGTRLSPPVRPEGRRIRRHQEPGRNPWNSGTSRLTDRPWRRRRRGRARNRHPRRAPATRTRWRGRNRIPCPARPSRPALLAPTGLPVIASVQRPGGRRHASRSAPLERRGSGPSPGPRPRQRRRRTHERTRPAGDGQVAGRAGRTGAARRPGSPRGTTGRHRHHRTDRSAHNPGPARTAAAASRPAATLSLGDYLDRRHGSSRQ